MGIQKVIDIYIIKKYLEIIKIYDKKYAEKYKIYKDKIFIKINLK